MKDIRIKPVKKFKGIIQIHSSKSLTIRALLIASMAIGNTKILNFHYCEDVFYVLKALKKIGINFFLSKNKKICLILGKGNGPKCNSHKLFLGNSGLGVRLLISMLCINTNNVIVDSKKEMRKRPIFDLVNSLKKSGSKIKFLSKSKNLPIKIFGKCNGGKIEVNSSISSQFLSSLLISLPLFPKRSYIINKKITSSSYIKMTINLMKIFGVTVKNYKYKYFEILGRNKYTSPGNLILDGDISNASYFLSAGAIKGKVRVYGINNLNTQGETKFINYLENMGINVKYGLNYIECRKSKIKKVNINAKDIPDSSITLSILSLFSTENKVTLVKNTHVWKKKESNRLLSVCNELKKIGVKIKLKKNNLYIYPLDKLNRNISINTYNDHRIAMCFSLISLFKVCVNIKNYICVNKTFPNFFKLFFKLCK
ncbi:MAG: 3-phosphoshikimate 1-carboxyvinyltransferase [Enterobacteriaceae bacterium]